MDKQLLAATTIGQDFLFAMDENLEQPSIDSFLDYRSALSRFLKAQSNEYLELEIKAVDEILTYLQNKKE